MSNEKEHPVEPGAWRNKEAAEAKLRNILQRGGIPLEIQTITTADAFRNRIAQRDAESGYKQSVAVTVTPGATFHTSTGTPREMDCVVTLTRRLATSGASFVVEARIPIECKHRANVEWFAFEMPKSFSNYTDNPLLAPLFSDPMGREFAEETEDWQHIWLPERRLTAVETKGFTLCNDTLLKEVAAAAYDYAVALRANHDQIIPIPGATTLRELKLLDRFGKFTGRGEQTLSERFLKTTGAEDSRISAFCDQLEAEDHQRYLSAIRGTTQEITLQIFVPVLCVNGPLWDVRLDPWDHQQNFVSMDFAAERLHLEQWPGKLMPEVLNARAAFPLVIAPISNLGDTLMYVDGMLGATMHHLALLSESPIVTGLPLKLAAHAFLRGQLSAVAT